MRKRPTALCFATAVLAAGLVSSPAQADPYRWCAEYSGGEGSAGSASCYFVTIEQCRAAVSGVGGFCVLNQFYTGLPVGTPADSSPRERRRS